MNPEATIQRMADTASVLRSFPSATEALEAVQASIDALEAAKVALVGELVESEAYKDAGSSSATGWLREHLRLDTREAKQVQRAAQTVRELPEVADAAARGELRPGHLDSLGYGLRHVGPELMQEPAIASLLLTTAAESEPAQLRGMIRQLRETLFPDDLDQAWIEGMERRDLKLTPLGEHGWHLTGFLDIGLGAKLDVVLRSLSAPQGAQDERTPAQRRLAGLDALLTGKLEHGLPQDRGVRPHLSVLVDHDELRAQATDPEAATAPAHLAGFGSVGRRFLDELMCGADLTPILMGGRHGVLDVGPSVRYATLKQRRAIVARQGGQCAGPGCTSPIVHIHHIVWHSRGGPTDLANLIGLCPSCHTLVHQDRLAIDPETHAFTRRTGPPVAANKSNHWLSRRRAHRRLRSWLREHAPPRAA